MLFPNGIEHMAKKGSRSGSENWVLSRLARDDLALLKPHLVGVDLPLFTELETGHRPIYNVYFPERGFASVMANGPGGPAVELGIIGRESMTGLAVVLGGDQSPQDTYVQAAGTGQRINAGKLRGAMDQSARLHRSLLSCAFSFYLQTAQTALSHRRNTTQERLARWVLMADDRLDGAALPLTHKLLSIMLGVHRPGATVAVQALERQGLITAGRGTITIVDRPALQKLCKGTYLPPG